MSKYLPERSLRRRKSGFQVERNSNSKGWEAENMSSLEDLWVFLCDWRVWEPGETEESH